VLVAIPREPRKRPDQTKAIAFALAVFLVIVLFGVSRLFRTTSPTVSNIRATSFAIHNTELHLEPTENAGVARAVANGSILRLSSVVRDNTGKAWFLVPEDGKEFAIGAADIAPPKVSEPEEGSKMLQAWLLSFDRPDLAADAVQAVNYYCVEFSASPHCEELRWTAAERLRTVAQRSSKRSELLAQTRELYKAVASQNGRHADEAKKQLETISDANPSHSSERPVTNSASTPKNAKPEFRQYALVDAAEVQLRIPDVSKLTPGASIQTPIAKEIRVNGQLVVPANAICNLEILSGSASGQGALARLTAIEFANRRYAVTTEPKRLDKPGAIVVFRLDSSLLIGH